MCEKNLEALIKPKYTSIYGKLYQKLIRREGETQTLN